MAIWFHFSENGHNTELSSFRHVRITRHKSYPLKNILQKYLYTQSKYFLKALQELSFTRNVKGFYCCMIQIKLCSLFHRRKKKTATPTSIRNKMPPITPPAIAPVFDLGSKTANLKNYGNYHPFKKFNTSIFTVSLN